MINTEHCHPTRSHAPAWECRFRRSSGAFLLSFFLFYLGQAAALPMQDFDVDAQGIAYVDDKTCQDCHQEAYQAWQGSDHDLAMQEANEQSVLADFNTEFKHGNTTTRFFKRDGEFWLNTENAAGQYQDFQILYTFGVRPLQQYLVKMPRGRLQAFDVAWDVEKKRWFHLQGETEIPVNDPLHWTGRYYTWNSQCAECHSTHLRLNYDLKTDSYQTQWSAIDVGCQACHGAGEKHLDWAKQAPEKRAKDNGLVLDFTQLKGKAVVERCARCHSRRYPLETDKAQTDVFSHDFMPMLLQEALYHADGQAKDEVYVYGSFSQTKMYQQGVDCLDCHQAHSNQLKRQGNVTCTHCHQTEPPVKDYPLLKAKNYDDPAHHFHQAGTDGAQCVNCHMPAKYDMQIDHRRDHRFAIPRPDLSAKTAVPNACNQCHSDKSADWAAAEIEKRTGKPKPNYADVLASYDGGEKAQMALLELFKQFSTPAIVRASVLEKLSQSGADHQPLFLQALKDPQALVRQSAARLLQAPLTPAQQQALVPLLDSDIASMRQEIARVLSLNSDFVPSDKAKFAEILQDYQQQLSLQADQAEGYFNLGNYWMQAGNSEKASKAYENAIARGAYFFPAYHNLANIYYQQKQVDKAAEIYQAALAKDPKQGAIHYSLGLLRAGEKQITEASKHIALAADLLPTDAGVQYNHSLLLQKQGKLKAAEQVLLAANQRTPEQTKILQGLSVLYLRAEQWAKAKPYVQALKLKHPQAKEPERWLQLIQEKLK